MRVYRIEFLQPDGRWTGPYTAEYMTPRAFELRYAMLKDPKITRPYPQAEIFANNPGKDRYVCASPSMSSLKTWFGDYLELLQMEGGHRGIYDVPQKAIAECYLEQVVYQQRQATLIKRTGTPIDPNLLQEQFHPNKFLTNQARGVNIK